MIELMRALFRLAGGLLLTTSKQTASLGVGVNDSSHHFGANFAPAGAKFGRDNSGVLGNIRELKILDLRLKRLI